MTVKRAYLGIAPFNHPGNNQGVRPFDIFINKQVKRGMGYLKINSKQGHAGEIQPTPYDHGYIRLWNFLAVQNINNV